jgi:hypothetical protein
VLSQDNTRVNKSTESIPITETTLYKQYLADPYRNTDFNTWVKRQQLIQSSRKDEKVTADKRSPRVKEWESKQGEAIHSQQERKKREAEANKVIWTGIGLGGLALAQATPAAPYIDAAFATHGALGLAKQADEGTLGLNLETGLNTLQMLPFGIRGVKYVDDVAREAYAPYDFYRTIQETTPVVKQPIQTEILVNPIKHTQKGSMVLQQRPSVKTAVTEPLDQIQTFRKRALLKTGKNIDDVPVFDLYTKEGRDAASKHLIKKHGLDPGETYDDAYNYYNKTFTDWANEDWFGPGMGWNEHGMAHVSKQLPEPLYSSAYVHEVGHALHYPKNPIPKGVFKETIKNHVVDDEPYFIKNNNTEIAEAINQVLTYHGIDHGNPISGNQLKRMFERFIKNMKQDNTKSFIYRNVADWDGLAEWANDWENVIGLGIPITIGAVTYGNEN